LYKYDTESYKSKLLYENTEVYDISTVNDEGSLIAATKTLDNTSRICIC